MNRQLDRPDQVRICQCTYRHLGLGDQHSENIGDLGVFARTDVVGRSRGAVFSQQAVCANDVADVQEVPARAEIAVGDRPAAVLFASGDLEGEGSGGELGRLAGPDVVERSGDDGVDTEPPVDLSGDRLRCLFGNSVRRTGLHR